MKPWFLICSGNTSLLLLVQIQSLFIVPLQNICFGKIDRIIDDMVCRALLPFTDTGYSKLPTYTLQVALYERIHDLRNSPQTQGDFLSTATPNQHHQMAVLGNTLTTKHVFSRKYLARS